MNAPLIAQVAAEIGADDFCPACGSDAEPGGGGLPCALCFLNQPGEEDQYWRVEEDRRRQEEHFSIMGWR